MASRSASLFPGLARAARSLYPRAPAVKQRSPFRAFATSRVRAAHDIPRPRPSPSARPDARESSGRGPDGAESEGPRPAPKDAAYYQISFTCVPCSFRSHHNISKQGYHFGSILISCPECRNRHVISDHLNIFGDRKITVEDLMRERGRLVKRGSLGEDGNIEFWPDLPPDEQPVVSESSSGEPEQKGDTAERRADERRE
ncbi:hypothetical protein CDD83_8045 [Cordyceps sp. RAO-2017]|nr:hypothetical protein CDD83_8045 [Cordyceps sp. RAO-2017]